jgi:hypothetical protein|tara:strand:- start:31 stop:579 length:549 start_codon:yes stop_codon:yes gene_type:complete
MESILAILCIVFFAVLTYGLIHGNNLTKNHLYNCRTLYIPEDIDLDTAYNSVLHKDINGLMKRARELGASKKRVDTLKKEGEPWLELKKYIIVNSISNEHILFNDITGDIVDKELVEKRDYCRKNNNNTTCPTIPNPTLGDYSNVQIPSPTNLLEQEHIWLPDPSISIQEMREDIDDYININ